MTAMDKAEILAFRGAVGALSLLRYGAAERCLRLLAGLVGPVGGLRRRVVDEQLAAAWPALDPAARRRLRNAVFDHLGRTAAEVFLADPAALAAQVRIEPGFDALDEALAGGRGAIAVTGHLGNFELGGRILAARYPLLDVVKPQRNPGFEQVLEDMRRRHGIATVPMDHALRPVLAHLRSGGLVSLLVDQDAGSSGLALDFLGRPASTWAGAARIALKAGCPVVPVAIVREERGHVFHIGPALDPPPSTGDVDGDTRAHMQAINDRLGAWVRRHPEQWFWVHRRWKGARRGR